MRNGYYNTLVLYYAAKRSKIAAVIHCDLIVIVCFYICSKIIQELQRIVAFFPSKF